MKRNILICLLLAALLLTGCSQNGNKSADAVNGGWEFYVEETAAANEKFEVASDGSLYGTNTLTTDLTVTDPNRKLIHTVSMDAETEDFETLMAGVSEQITRISGYVEEQYIYGNRTSDANALRSASLTIRIPSQQLSEFVSQVERLSNVVSSSQTAEDVTLSYSDTESRVKALEVERDRLMELLEKAETTQDLLEIESRLTDVRYQLESAQSQLRLYDNLVSYSTVHLSIQEVKVLTPTQEPTVWERISRGFQSSLEGLADFFINLFVLAASALPIWLPLVLIALLIWRLVRRAGKKRARNHPEDSTGEPGK